MSTAMKDYNIIIYETPIKTGKNAMSKILTSCEAVQKIPGIFDKVR
jgi:hypothetical protein